MILCSTKESIAFQLFNTTKLNKLPLLPHIIKSKKGESTLRNKKGRKSILIAIENSNTRFTPVYSLIPLLNTLVNVDIYITFDRFRILPFYNTNIFLLKRNLAEIDSIIETCDLIIGSGEAVTRTITLKKPCIIVGERGYGGILNNDVFNYQYIHNFQGRIGGSLEEYIPENLILEDINTVFSYKESVLYDLTSSNYNLLQNQQSQIKNRWRQCLSDIIKNSSDSNMIDSIIHISKDYALIHLSDEIYIISEVHTRKIHSQIGKDEADIINLFAGGNYLQQAISNSAFSDKPELIIDFVKILITEKILIKYDNQ